VVAGRYEIQSALGEGGMGSVFRARDRTLRVNVAFKVLRLTQDATAVRRFHHEVALARKVKHENVCAVYEYGEDQGILFCTMELVGGRNLRQVIREQAPLPVDRAYGLALKAAAGLRAIHEAGVLHRDLKTSNIMVDGKDRVRLVDFGIAKAMPASDAEEPTTDTPVTGGEAIVGTPAYMSPEQVMGWPLDARSDVYSFGIVLFEMFTGELPFPGSSRAGILRKQMEEPPPLHGRLAQSLPIGLVPILERAMAKDPDQRYANVAALIQDLERTRDSFQTRTMDVLSPGRPRRWLLPALALVAGGVLIAVRGGHPPRELRPVPEATSVPHPPLGPISMPPPGATPSVVPPSPSSPPILAPSPTRSLSSRVFPQPTISPVRTVSAAMIPASTSTTTSTSISTTTTTMAPVPVTVAAALATTTTIPSMVVERPPACISCPPPPYPPAAASYGLQGHVELEIAVDASGNVTSTRVVSGHIAFRAAAQKAARSWRFLPATRDGVPIPFTLTKIVEFRQPPRP